MLGELATVAQCAEEVNAGTVRKVTQCNTL